MNKKIRITITVGELRFPIWIDPKEEPIFRDAGRRLNHKLVEYRRRFHDAGLSNEDMLAMTLIDLAVELERKDSDTDPVATAQTLDDIMTDLQSFMDDAPAAS